MPKARIKIKKGRLVVFLIFLQLLTTYPYVFEQFLPLPGMQAISMAITAMLMALIFARKKVKKIPGLLLICFAVQIIVWVGFSIIHGDTSYFTRIYFIVSAVISVWALASTGSIGRFTAQNNSWLCAQSVLGLIAVPLVFVGLLHSFFEFSLADGRPAYFFGLTCSNAVFGNLARACGFFDEPGALAFWGIYALVLNQLFVKNKKLEMALMVGLISTLSMMYFLQLALYFLFFKIKNIKLVILAGLCLLAGIILIRSNPDSDLYLRTFQRVEDAQSGTTNRDKMVEEARYYFYKNPLFGVGAIQSEKLAPVSDNPYETLATDGIVGTICIYLPLLIIALGSFKSREFLWAVLVLAAGYAIRPFHVMFIQYFFIYLFLFLFLKRETVNRNFIKWRSREVIPGCRWLRSAIMRK